MDSEKNLDEVWTTYKKTGSLESREHLILNYAPLVKYVAGRVTIGLPPNIEMDDLMSYGVFGLVDSIEKFDPQRGVKFETYGISRIRGAIIDGLRSTDWVPRSVRKKARDLEEVVAVLEAKMGRPPSDEQVAAAMHISLKEYHQALNEVSATTLTSLDEVWSKGDSGDDKIPFLEMVQDEDSEDPGLLAEQSETKRLLAEAIDALPERERLVISLYYYEGLTLKEIGHVLEVSESRVCQMHTKAILRLKGKLSRVLNTAS